jgi:cytochrome c peroxidase
MHQGQLATLADVVRYYSTLEGRIPPGPDDEKILAPLNLDAGESADLIAFLESLTGAPLPPELLRKPPSPK